MKKLIVGNGANQRKLRELKLFRAIWS